MFDVFRKSWRGEASLATAFWVVHFLGSLVLGYLLVVIFGFFHPHLNYEELAMRHSPLMQFILLPYTLFSAFCVWRCGKNSTWFWSIVSKILVSIAVLSGIASIVKLFAAL